jgi:hypothetical protein
MAICPWVNKPAAAVSYYFDTYGAASSSMINLKRAYDPPDSADNRRILVDRFWPRGLSNAKLSISEWLPELVPSNELRRYFGHDPEKWRMTAYRAPCHGMLIP